MTDKVEPSDGEKEWSLAMQRVAFGGLFAHPGLSNIFISDLSKRKR